MEEKEKRRFITGAVRDSNKGKPRPDLLHPYVRLRVGYHLAKGCEKYGDRNFEKGMPDETFLESLHRHLAQYELGDRSEDHLAAIIFGAMGCMLNEYKSGVKVKEYYDKN